MHLAPDARRLDNAIQQIGVSKTNHAIHWIVIYLMNSVIHFSSNQGLAQVVRKVDKAFHWINHYPVRLADFPEWVPIACKQALVSSFFTQVLHSCFLFWHASESLHVASPLVPPVQTRQPARRLSYPSFVQPGPGESVALI